MKKTRNKEIVKNRYDVKASNSLKGIAILMMIMHHCFRKESVFSDFSGSFYPFQEYQIVNISSMFKICVSIFVFISGYGLYLSYKKSNIKVSPSKWILIREIKLLSGYWFILILSIIICESIDGLVTTTYFSNGVDKGIIYIFNEFLGVSRLFNTPSINGAWWYMSAAFFFVLIVPIIADNDKYLCIITVISFFILRVLGINYLGQTAVCSFLPIFLLGMLVAKTNFINIWINFGNIPIKILRFVFEAMLIILCYKLYTLNSNSSLWELKWNIFPVVIIFFCVEYVVTVPLLRQLLIFLGKHSRNIFLIHIFIKTTYLEEYIYSFNHFAIVICMVLLISLLISIAVELLKKILFWDFFINKLCKVIGNPCTIKESVSQYIIEPDEHINHIPQNTISSDEIEVSTFKEPLD